MKSILICSDVPAAAEKILSVLSGSGYAVRIKSDPVSACGDGAEENIVLFVLSSVHGWEDAARYFSEQTTAGLLALVREGAREEAERRFAGLGIPVLGISLSCKALLTVLKFAEKSAERLSAVRSENKKLKDAIDDLKLIDRAKCALIRYLNMTEADAHRFIEKQAMNKRLPRREIALHILNAYES